MRRTGWERTDVIEDDDGGPWAIVEGNGTHPRSNAQAHGASDGQWTLAEHAMVRRAGGVAIVDAPFVPVRILCVSEEAAKFAGHCAAGARAHNAQQRAMVRHGAAGGLLAPCAHGLRMADEATQSATRGWSCEEARLWESTALGEKEEDLWPGTRHRPMPRIRTSEEHRGEHDVTLEGAGCTRRAIPGSAAEFVTQAVEGAAFGRWLDRFARIRHMWWAHAGGQRYEAARRGTPEGGALGALRLWPAIHQVEGIERGLYGYNAFEHTLRPVAPHIEEILARSMASMTGTQGKPAGVVIVSNRAERLGAKYGRITLSIALQNAGACVAAATVAGKYEGIVVRGNGRVPGDEWLEATGIDPRREAPIGAFAFGRRSARSG